MKVCILQPSYIPWKGFFHQVYKADAFVFLDTVQYDKRGWRNRNKIKTPQGEAWLTIPVHAKGTHQGLVIKDVCVTDQSWAKGHLQKIILSYRQAPFFQQEIAWIEPLLLETAETEERISRITATLIKAIAARIGIEGTRFYFASDFDILSTDPTARLLQLTQSVGGTAYLSGPSAQAYMEMPQFEAAGIPVEWMAYDYSEYPQLYPPFTHHVSILDLIFMVGSAHAGQYIWGAGLASVDQPELTGIAC